MKRSVTKRVVPPMPDISLVFGPFGKSGRSLELTINPQHLDGQLDWQEFIDELETMPIEVVIKERR